MYFGYVRFLPEREDIQYLTENDNNAHEMSRYITIQTEAFYSFNIHTVHQAVYRSSNLFKINCDEEALAEFTKCRHLALIQHDLQ